MKHDWNSLKDYIERHERFIHFYQRYMETPRVYKYEWITDQYLNLSCAQIILNTYIGTRVRVDIDKDVEVDDSNPKRPKARTYSYSYSANIPGGKNLIRYCSPHEDWEEEGAALHHKHHHKHDFTVQPTQILLLAADEWPHVSQFFDEVLSSF